MKSSLSQRNHNITEAEGKVYVNQYLENNPLGEGGVAAYFSAAALRKVLAQPNAAGIRYYYGKDLEDGNVLVLTATNEAGHDLLDEAVLFLGAPLAEEERPGFASPQLSVAAAAGYTARYRAGINQGEIHGGAFNRAAVERVLNQPDTPGLTFHFGLNEHRQRVIVISAVTPQGEDRWQGQLAELGLPCPPVCGLLNPLNSGLPAMRGVTLKVM
ncbi:MAG: hypothetical protein KDI06_01225 [Calditrichaeota bacterium]|nr:hypothetical protein [Calditrichota bacterium]